jgi:hypothetical protein
MNGLGKMQIITTVSSISAARQVLVHMAALEAQTGPLKRQETPPQWLCCPKGHSSVRQAVHLVAGRPCSSPARVKVDPVVVALAVALSVGVDVN